MDPHYPLTSSGRGRNPAQPPPPFLPGAGQTSSQTASPSGAAPNLLAAAQALRSAATLDASLYGAGPPTSLGPLPPLNPLTARTQAMPASLYPSTSSIPYPHLAPPTLLRELHPSSAFMHTAGPFSASGPMMTPTTTTSPASTMASDMAALAPSGHGIVPLRPMPRPTDVAANPSLMTNFDSTALFASPRPADRDVQPTHVVGSQGRRGILPSAPGRAAAPVSAGASGKNVVVPAKDADGKFPCPHCNKTYLHAKHLKRHLLRHTGDRPYVCVLCRDTFSRSDILKRHFQKCSLRRGNPTGATHLHHTQSHLRQAAAAGPASETAPAAADDAELLPTSDEVNDGPDEAIADQASYTDESAPVSTAASRRNSLKRPIDGGGIGRDRRSLTGPGPAGSSRASFDGAQLNGSVLRAGLAMDAVGGAPLPAMAELGHPSLAYQGPFDFGSREQGAAPPIDGRPVDAGALGAAMDGQEPQRSEIDWAQFFPADASAGYAHAMFDPQMAAGSAAPRAEPASGSGSFPSSLEAHEPTGFFGGFYASSATSGGDGSSMTDGFPNWQLDMAKTDPLLAKAERLVGFCFPDPVVAGSEAWAKKEEVAGCLTVDNVRSFVRLFTNFQGHWPLIHMPTFSVMKAYDGLLLTIICIGAVYSDRLRLEQVRTLMEHTRAAAERTSPLFGLVAARRQGRTEAGVEGAGPEAPTDIEQIQAFTLMQVLFTWHGDQEQRMMARNDFIYLVDMARTAELLRPVSAGHPAYSRLHQADLAAEEQVEANFDWPAWVAQEKRVRIMYTVYLLDTALVMYFNMAPQFDSLEIRNPLPADDVAWEASTASDCADALGLHGPAAQASNDTGSRRVKQPEMHTAMKALLHPNLGLQPGSTNLFSKFILIHALHVQIWTLQKQLSQQVSSTAAGDRSVPGSGSSTPPAPNDYVMATTAAEAARAGAGAAGGVAEASAAAAGGGAKLSQRLKTITSALVKWKKAWDEDMAAQYPPGTESTPSRRVGFGRDGVPFYWLARAFLRNSRALDWQVPPDARLMQVMSLLRKVQQWVASDLAQRGEEMGSVGEIDASYGVEELVLDMKLLFKPISDRIESPMPSLEP